MAVVTLKQNIFKDYLNTFWVETGTYEGDAIQKALDAGFQYCYSIELSEKYYMIASERFKNDPRVRIIYGDSAYVLFDVIKNIRGKITFWLDGHFSKDDTALGTWCSPLIQEIKQIQRHSTGQHTVIIDDMRNWRKVGICNCPLYPCDKIYGFDEADIINELLRINLNYQFEYIDGFQPKDILIAHP